MDEVKQLYDELSTGFDFHAYTFVESAIMDLRLPDNSAYATKLVIGNDKILWVNPLKQDGNGQMLFYFTNDSDEITATKNVNRILSIINFAAGPISSYQTTLVKTGAGAGTFRSPYRFRLPSPQVVQVQPLIDKIKFNEIEERDWYALAYFRQASISSSDFFQYMCLWDILSLYCEGIKDDLFAKINQLGPDTEAFSSFDDYGREGELSLSLDETRNICAHLFVARGQDIETEYKDPDNPKLTLRIKNHKLVLLEIITVLMSQTSALEEVISSKSSNLYR